MRVTKSRFKNMRIFVGSFPTMASSLSNTVGDKLGVAVGGIAGVSASKIASSNFFVIDGKRITTDQLLKTAEGTYVNSGRPSYEEAVAPLERTRFLFVEPTITSSK